MGSGARWVIDGLKLLETSKIGSVRSSFDNSFTSRANQILFFLSGSGVKKSISFVGMAGCGKTTIGRLFAKKHGVSFIDTDHLIEKKLNKSLQDIKDEKGYMYLREIEQEIVLAIDTSIQIISTGGSVIYSEQAITHLKQISSVVHEFEFITSNSNHGRTLSHRV